MTPIGRVESTGIHVDLGTSKSRADYPAQRDGEHLWIAMSVFRIADPAAAQLHLDTESLLSIEGPGCYYCEEPYSPRLALRRCKGEPR